jgi:hypothetical protein
MGSPDVYDEFKTKKQYEEEERLKKESAKKKENRSSSSNSRMGLNAISSKIGTKPSNNDLKHKFSSHNTTPLRSPKKSNAYTTDKKAERKKLKLKPYL